ncbi:hypothetical protein [Photobacterium phosphoreum]|uniref:hypothetical protein n=1 Tax=Photobacterium phosphoreum TaxID=659 RepID=UPI0024B64BF3|nr:hypothetical protein [Photobacterium phosphoreum]
MKVRIKSEFKGTRSVPFTPSAGKRLEIVGDWVEVTDSDYQRLRRYYHLLEVENAPQQEPSSDDQNSKANAPQQEPSSDLTKDQKTLLNKLRGLNIAKTQTIKKIEVEQDDAVIEKLSESLSNTNDKIDTLLKEIDEAGIPHLVEDSNG